MNADYDAMTYRYCGKSGLKLPVLSLGLWHNFGSIDSYENARAMIRTAFSAGITHFDLANNYGPEPGSAEITFGRILKQDLHSRRDELVISTKAGYGMWPGPYGDGGSRKYLLSSLDQSLKRMQLDYVDIFYHHRPDPEVPMEESLRALDHAVNQGKCLYAGISSYSGEQTRQAVGIFRELGTPFIIHQVKYNMFHREPEHDLFDVLKENGTGCIVFSPLEQGLLTDRYLDGIPRDSRAAKPSGFLNKDQVTQDRIEKVQKLAEIASEAGYSMAEFALAWVLKNRAVTSVIIGASTSDQISKNLGLISKPELSTETMEAVEQLLAD